MIVEPQRGGIKGIEGFTLPDGTTVKISSQLEKTHKEHIEHHDHVKITNIKETSERVSTTFELNTRDAESQK